MVPMIVTSGPHLLSLFLVVLDNGLVMSRINETARTQIVADSGSVSTHAGRCSLAVVMFDHDSGAGHKSNIVKQDTTNRRL